MAKKKKNIIKRWWITMEDNSPLVKELSFKDAEKSKLKTKLFFEKEEIAKKYSSYLATRHKGD
ncbi:MAG: hypothetical protein PF569_01505 [Candidatus Woesearchaeota archaeon]|jgi:hypothetical protein|nr:hypothetical protein [Candidatus Woesearchaeota archaeon]